ncbi:hypothetical protein SARC_13225 [Sphaeroforma arctica JP610]|uniref:Uncharacterized protein n=1 Tax=Sphaeroforma arctica JP610 TaxID=667725 RepID=A0A0L0FBT5_9EUKA|nr:hypothetical protein SARC_13225 [Sphaeroforma arctica JP610]KNC74222.1 hypothetical protein SARC_13225 [Sphaeroforma arctica JP610]|eukprot:XP_014148124.1 hypothetical protein SARC_13225 [Sphaeroforma arctica JP610]
MKTSLLSFPWERELQPRFHGLDDAQLAKLRAALDSTLYLSLSARIGSPSMSAVVYKTEVAGFPVAVKFEPNMNKAMLEGFAMNSPTESQITSYSTTIHQSAHRNRTII